MGTAPDAEAGEFPCSCSSQMCANIIIGIRKILRELKSIKQGETVMANSVAALQAAVTALQGTATSLQTAVTAEDTGIAAILSNLQGDNPDVDAAVTGLTTLQQNLAAITTDITNQTNAIDAAVNPPTNSTTTTP